eukprot:Colp12_sorted_trinity150504_noHs@26480
MVFLEVFLGLLYLGIKLIRSVFKGSPIKLKGKSVFITGCDTGFGNLLAKRLAEAGATVYAGCFTAEGAKNLQKETKDKVQTILLDVTKPETIAAAYEKVKAGCANTGLWACVNNAGIFGGFLIDATPMEEFRRVMEVNYFGLVAVTKQFLPLVIKAKGRVINVASVAGRTTMPSLCAYASSKHAVEAFSDTLRLEVAGWGVKVVIIEPSFMSTNILTQAMPVATRIWDNAPEDLRACYGGNELLKRLEAKFAHVCNTAGNPELVVDAMTTACTDPLPEERYQPGVSSKFLVAVTHFVPAWIVDLPLRAFFSFLPWSVAKNAVRKI